MTTTQRDGLRPAEVEPVPLDKAYRLLNPGATTLVCSRDGDRRNVMAASWTMALDFRPAKVCVVIDRQSWTRELVEASGRFTLNLPAVPLAQATYDVGQRSGRDGVDKFALAGLQTFAGQHPASELVVGCLGWLECRVLDESAVRTRHDLVLAEVDAAWADRRAFRDAHWQITTDTPDALRSLHYVAGGHFLKLGSPIEVETRDAR